MSSYIKIVYILSLVTFLSIWCYTWTFSQIRTFLKNYFNGDIYGNLGFPGGSDGKESTCNVGDLGLIPGWEDHLEEGMATHSSIIAWRIPTDRGAWWAPVHGVTKSQTRQSDSAQHTYQVYSPIIVNFGWYNTFHKVHYTVFTTGHLKNDHL